MSRPRVRRLWLPVLAVVMAVICIRLGFWQLDRLEGRRERNAAIAAGLTAPPVDVQELLETGSPDAVAYRPVTTGGVYDPSGELVLYGRPLDGRPGDHVLTPLVLDDGTRVLVDRGWIPFVSDRELPLGDEAAAPAGRVEVTGVVLASEDDDAFGDQDPATATIVRTVNLGQIADATGSGLAPVYLVLQTQQPAQPLPVPAPIEDLVEGPHLSYAIQWFAFAAVALVGAFAIERRRSKTRTSTAG